MSARRLHRAALIAAAAALGFAAAGGGYLTWRAMQAPQGVPVTLSTAGLGGDFELTDQHGATVRASDLHGKAVVLFFGYTHCPDVCPSTLFTMSQARKRLGADAERFQGVFVTVDPQRDTPERLREYVGYFDPSFLALTGSEAELAGVARSFGASFQRGEPDGDGGYLMAHSTFGYLIDPAGRVVKLYPPGTTPDEIAADVRALLAAGD